MTTPLATLLAGINRTRDDRDELTPGSPVPSESHLQQRYGASRGTARKAVELLRSQGLVYTVSQRCTYVAEQSR